MDNETDWKGTNHPSPGSWRDDETRFLKEAKQQLKSIETAELSPQDQSKLLELLGLINFKILSGDSLYLEVDGARYKEGGWIVKDCSLKFIATRSASFELV